MIELSDVIRDLRGQLEQALAEGDGHAIRFELGAIELEVTLVLDRRSEGGGKVRFWVAELGGSGTDGRTDTQRLRLTLQPRLPSGESPKVSGFPGPSER